MIFTNRNTWMLSLASRLIAQTSETPVAQRAFEVAKLACLLTTTVEAQFESALDEVGIHRLANFLCRQTLASAMRIELERRLTIQGELFVAGANRAASVEECETKIKQLIRHVAYCVGGRLRMAPCEQRCESNADSIAFHRVCDVRPTTLFDAAELPTFVSQVLAFGFDAEPVTDNSLPAPSEMLGITLPPPGDFTFIE
jgi:hypothetical protein